MSDTKDTSSPIEEVAQSLGRIISAIEEVRIKLSSVPSPPAEQSAQAPSDDDAARAELLHWKSLVEAIRDIASGRPEISERRSKEAWQGTALLQSSMLGEVSRLCNEHLRSTVTGPRPLGATLARGPKTEATAERDGFHIKLKWIRKGTEFAARIYEPMMMDITPALADVLALSVEEPLRVNAEYGL